MSSNQAANPSITSTPRDEAAPRRLGQTFSPHLAQGTNRDEQIGTDTIIVTIRGVRGHDCAYHGLLESLYPATRIM